MTDVIHDAPKVHVPPAQGAKLHMGNQYLIRIDSTRKQYSEVKANLGKYDCKLKAACFETGKSGDNPHYHVLVDSKYKDSYLRKNFLSQVYPKSYSLKEYNPYLEKRTQQYFSKKENARDEVLLADWNVKEAHEAYWKENEQLKSKCNTISDKLVHFYKNKFQPPSDEEMQEQLDIINKYRHETQSFDERITKEELSIYYSNLEYFRINSKLIPLDYDMKKYIRTVQLKLQFSVEQIYAYYNTIAMPFFQQYK